MVYSDTENKWCRWSGSAWVATNRVYLGMAVVENNAVVGTCPVWATEKLNALHRLVHDNDTISVRGYAPNESIPRQTDPSTSLIVTNPERISEDYRAEDSYQSNPFQLNSDQYSVDGDNNATYGSASYPQPNQFAGGLLAKTRFEALRESSAVSIPSSKALSGVSLTAPSGGVLWYYLQYDGDTFIDDTPPILFGKLPVHPHRGAIALASKVVTENNDQQEMFWEAF